MKIAELTARLNTAAADGTIDAKEAQDLADAIDDGEGVSLEEHKGLDDGMDSVKGKISDDAKKIFKTVLAAPIAASGSELQPIAEGHARIAMNEKGLPVVTLFGALPSPAYSGGYKIEKNGNDVTVTVGRVASFNGMTIQMEVGFASRIPLRGVDPKANITVKTMTGEILATSAKPNPPVVVDENTEDIVRILQGTDVLVSLPTEPGLKWSIQFADKEFSEAASSTLVDGKQQLSFKTDGLAPKSQWQVTLALTPEGDPKDIRSQAQFVFETP